MKNLDSDEEKIEIDRSQNKGGTLAFLSPQKFHKPLLAALDASLKIQLPFSDVDTNSEYYEPLSELYSRNLIGGYADGTFQPDRNISRAEFVKIALGVTQCLDCLNPSDAEKSVFYEVNSFPDVKPEDWFDFCVSKAKKLTMVEGYGDGFFKPGNSISRAEAVAILLRQADLPMQNFAVKPMIDVPDYAWYKNAMITGLNLGLVQENYGYTFPDEEITRGEFAQMAAILFSLRDCHFIDSDGDGIPDYLETYNGLNPADPSDGEGVERGDLIDPKNNISTAIPHQGEDNGEEGSYRVSPDSEADLCPLVPEDLDGVDDEDGCPEISEGGENNGNGNTSGEEGDGNNETDGSENNSEDETDGSNETDGSVDSDSDGDNDNDGNDNNSGEGGENSNTEEQIVVIPGDSSICGFIDYRAQIRKGDSVWAAILADDDSEIFSESNSVHIEEHL